MKTLIFACMLTVGVVSCATVNHSNPQANGNANANAEHANHSNPQADGNANAEYAQFIGAWNWTKTQGGIGYQIINAPNSTWKTIQLNLMKDHQFSVIDNGKKTASGTYEITLKKSIYSGEMDNFIHFNGDYMDGIIRVEDTNTLTIADNHPDGTTMTFLKK